MPRSRILNVKFIYGAIRCFALALSNLFLDLAIGFALQIDCWSFAVLGAQMRLYFSTTFFTLWLCTPIAFFALWGKGYLVPLGVVMLMLALGLGAYFPWVLPGLYSGAGGEAFKVSLNTWSYAGVLIAGLADCVARQAWWQCAVHK